MATSAEDKLMLFFFIFPEKVLTFHAVSPLEVVSMKCQACFLGEKKTSTELFSTMFCIKMLSA